MGWDRHALPRWVSSGQALSVPQELANTREKSKYGDKHAGMTKTMRSKKRDGMRREGKRGNL